MNKRIEDEFTHLKISRQRKYQLRMLRDKRCTECGAPAVQGTRCLKHLIRARERQRSVRGLKRRYYNTLSYQLERQSAPARKTKPRKGVSALKVPKVSKNSRMLRVAKNARSSRRSR